MEFFSGLPETEYIIIWNVTVRGGCLSAREPDAPIAGMRRREIDKVQRWSSLGREDFEERVGECSWEVALVIPYSAFFMHNITSLDGKTIRAISINAVISCKLPIFCHGIPLI